MMLHPNFNQVRLRLISILVFSLASFPVNLLKTPAQVSKSPLSNIQFNLPDLGDKDAPGDTEGAGRRGTCPKINTPLTALVLRVKKSPYFSNVWGLTLEKSPTLWFYIPYSPTDVSSGELIIWDETDADKRKHQKIYQGNFSLQNTPGIISLSLPHQVKLEKDRRYHWYLSVPIKCDSENAEVGVNGWVWIDTKRLNLASPILSGKLSKQEQAVILAEHGIWQDVLTLVSQTSEADWKQLLTEINLKHLVSEKIVPCCSLNTSN